MWYCLQTGASLVAGESMPMEALTAKETGQKHQCFPAALLFNVPEAIFTFQKLLFSGSQLQNYGSFLYLGCQNKPKMITVESNQLC